MVRALNAAADMADLLDEAMIPHLEAALAAGRAVDEDITALEELT
jgi:hypothetical protein